jgi:predicted transcriptional regulator
MSMEGVPTGGLRRIGQILATNPLTFDAQQNGLTIAVALLSSHTAGAPVVDEKGKYLGFINEFDVLKALDAGKDLAKLAAEDIMRQDRLVIHTSTEIAEAAKIMEEHSVLNLPVEQYGVVAYSVSRHDLLRARIGLGVGMGLEP